MRDDGALKKTNPTWWGTFSFDLESTRCWKIASLELWVQRLQREWRIGFHENTHADIENNKFNIDDCSGLPGQEITWERYLVNDTLKTLQVQPALAPRPVVVRPTSPLHIPSGVKISLFVNTPLWMQFFTDKKQQAMRELAIVRPSDTWFGANTMQGQLCYSTRSRGTLDVADIHHRPHRAVTQMHIFNSSDQTLVLDKVSLPVELLALYADTAGVCWTQDITLTREEDGEIAKVEISKSIPMYAEKVRRINEPRKVAENGILVRAFQTIFN